MGTIVITLFAGSLFAGACAESPTSIACDSICAAVERCGLMCADDCEDNFFQSLTSNGAAAIESCAADQQCPIDDTILECMVERVEITAAAQQHCRRRAQAYFTCGVIINATTCEQIHSTWSDEVLESLDACLNAPCSELNECLAQAYS